MKAFTSVIILLLSYVSLSTTAQTTATWPTSLPEAHPYTRWWWLGSAVDEAGLKYNLSEYAKAGIGGVEITPIYGVKGNDANNIDYLSPKWMKMLEAVEQLSQEFGLEVNMATGTGWPFGGPNVPESEKKKKLLQRLLRSV